MTNVHNLKSGSLKSTRTWKRLGKKMGVNLLNFGSTFTKVSAEQLLINLVLGVIVWALTNCFVCAAIMFVYMLFVDAIIAAAITAYESLRDERIFA